MISSFLCGMLKGEEKVNDAAGPNKKQKSMLVFHLGVVVSIWQMCVSWESSPPEQERSVLTETLREKALVCVYVCVFSCACVYSCVCICVCACTYVYMLCTVSSWTARLEYSAPSGPYSTASKNLVWLPLQPHSTCSPGL